MRLLPGRKALDIASGEGRNSVFLARNGFSVTAVDISDIGLSKGRIRAEEADVEVDFQQVDLDGFQITGEYDLVINFNFLLRDLINEEVRALSPGGIIVFDTILESETLLESHNPDYLLRRGELQRIFEKFDGDILSSEEVIEGDMPTARLLFRKSGV
jgi:2-polyprenyl-3-methyl-5-hydroxy-6-metoxy-1,4-benzoquinol methylase